MSRKLSSWIDSYLEYSRFSEAPDTFHFWTAVSCIGGALRRRVWIDQGYFQWTPNFYIIFVAPPGIVSKSTTANIGMDILGQVPGIHFGPQAITWQALVQSLSQAKDGFTLDEQLHAYSAITIAASEMGTFLNPHDRDMVDVLVDLWDGRQGVWKKATKTMGDDKIVNPWINIIACTTPAWIQGNFPEYMIGGGFTSRTIFVYAEEKRHLEAYPGRRVLDPSVQRIRDDLLHDLEHISVELIGEYSLDAGATRWGEQWYERLYEANRETLSSDRFASYIARKQTHLHKLAIILAASGRDERVLHAGDLQLAEGHLLRAEEHQSRVFERIVAPEARAANLVVDIMRRKGSCPYTELMRILYQQMSKDQLEQGLETGVAAGFLTIQMIGNTRQINYHEPATSTPHALPKSN